jgi:predicted acylesterase/phospholipase RssA
MDEPQSIAGYVELPLYPGDVRSEFRPITMPTTSGAPADVGGGLEPWHGRALRVALAMKGGLSLAVWIGGAIAELDVLRRIRIYRDGDRPRALVYHIGHHDDVAGGSAPLIARSEHYAAYLATRGYDHVEFDVLAGASAGGLNGVLYGTAQRAGVGYDSILDTWVETGSAWGLLQTGKPGAFDSVMRGDTYFWPQVATAIDTIATDKVSSDRMRAPQVVIDLSATLIDAVDNIDRAASEGRAQFRFVGDDKDELHGRAIPSVRHEQSVDYAADVARIAYAARTTSSFPAMFEPALIYSGSAELESEHGWERPRAAGDRCAVDAPDMRMVFNAHRADATTHPFRVVDGGLLDNIPIDRALNAVRDLPAEEHINRAIIYLDPSPKESAALFRRPTAYEAARPTLTYRSADGRNRFEPESQSTRTDVASRLMGTAIASLRKRGARESRDDEIEEVDLVRAAVSVVKARNELLAVRMDGSAPAGEGRKLAMRAYAIYRATSDLELLAPALLHPGDWLLGTDLRERAALIALDRIGMIHVESAFRTAAEAIQDGDGDGDSEQYARILHGRQSLVDACFTTLSWIRAIENTAFQEGVLQHLDADLRPHHRRTLRVRLNTVLREARRRRDVAILKTIEGTQPDIRGCSLVERQAKALGERWIGYDTEPSDGLKSAWRLLDGIVEELFEVSTHVDAMTASHVRWQRTPWSRLVPPESPRGFASQLPLIFGGSGIPQPISSVRFHRIGSDVQPARPTEYRMLLEDQLLRGYRGALARPLDELDAVTVHNYLEESILRSNAKLAGLRTVNLAGFLSSDWRVNDWWWGRLDASAGIVEFLDALPPAPAKRSSPDERRPAPDHAEPIPARPAGEVLDDVHGALLRQLAEAPRPPFRPVKGSEPVDASNASEIRDRMVRGAQGLEALSDSYRTAIVSRTLRAASSAMNRGERLSSVKRFTHWLLRPVAAVVPALVSRPRLVLLFTFLISGALLIWPTNVWRFQDGMTRDATWGASLVVTVVIVALAWGRLASGMISKRRRLRRIREHTTTKIHTRAVIDKAEARARSGRVVLDIATILAGIAVVAIDAFSGMGTVLFWAVLLSLFAVSEAAIHAAQTVPSTLAPPRSTTLFAVIGGIVAVAATTATQAFMATPGVEAILSPAVWHALGALVIAGAIAAVMLAGCFRRHRMLALPVALVAISAAFAAAAVTLGFASFPAPVRQIAEVLVVGWVAGTVLWWAPWWHGRATAPIDAPSDEVRDVEWPTLITERASASMPAPMPSRDSSGSPAPVPST